MNDSIRTAVKKAANSHKNDIDKAVDRAERDIRQLPEFADYQRSLVRHAIRQMIQDFRHKVNIATRQESRASGTAPVPKSKVVVGASTLVAKAATKWLDYFVGGKTLGALTGAELLPIANAEQERATGYIFNARLLTELSRMVPKDKRVSEVLTDRKIDSVAKTIRKTLGDKAA